MDDFLSPLTLNDVDEDFEAFNAELQKRLGTVVQSPLADAKIRFRDLSVNDNRVIEKVLIAVERVLRSGQLIMGAEVAEFESKFASYTNVPYAVGVSSGTAAITAALTAFGIGSDDEVITTVLAPVSVPNAIIAAGATPIFIDINDDLNIDPAAIRPAITSRTKAIVAVHYTGRLCDMRQILDIAKVHNLRVIEDASQAFGANNPFGFAGSFGDAAAVSVSQMKIPNSYGETGIVLTRDKKIADRLRILRNLGTVHRELCIYPMTNIKIDTLQAAMTVATFDQFPTTIKRRLEIAGRYDAGLKHLVTCPIPPSDENDLSCVFFDYTIQLEQRDALRHWLEREGIEVKVRHPLVLSDHPAYANLPKLACPVGHRMVQRILSLPVHEKLSDQQVDQVINSIQRFFDLSES